MFVCMYVCMYASAGKVFPQSNFIGHVSKNNKSMGMVLQICKTTKGLPILIPAIKKRGNSVESERTSQSLLKHKHTFVRSGRGVVDSGAPNSQKKKKHNCHCQSIRQFRT